MPRFKQTRAEYYLRKEVGWKQLSRGVWIRGGKSALEGVNLIAPRAYVASGLTNVSEILSRGRFNAFKRHLERLGDVLEERGIASVVPHRDTDPERDASIPASAVHRIDEKKVSHSGLIVADVSHASTGTGMELEIACPNPIILLLKKNTKISRMPLGSPQAIAVIEYGSYAEARKKLAKILDIMVGKPSKTRKLFAELMRAQDRNLFNT